jgi:hypothetical protein
VYGYGAVVQWGCNSEDQFQGWELAQGTQTPYGPAMQLENVGAAHVYHVADCLDADADQVYNSGAIIQWGCNASDPFQEWIAETPSGPGGVIQFVNYGALLEGRDSCLDANAYQNYDGGGIIQWACNVNDPYQLWNHTPGTFGGYQFQVAGSQRTSA